MSQKQYSFDFVLNAVLNGGFSSTFTKAQQEFIRLGNEIKNLQAIQRDIAAYQKQQQAVENTTGKLDNLRRQYELVNRQISETTGSTTALEREKLKLEQRIASTEAALEKQRTRLEDTKGRLDAAGVSTGELAGKDAELTQRIKELTEEQKKAAEGAGEFRNAGVEAIEAVGGAIAAAGIAEAVKGIADAYGECVEASGSFEQAMSAAEAIAEANKSEMAALKAEAKELGATTIYTAQQSAKSMEYMSMAGWDAQEMLVGMSGMTTLAAAAGEDLAQVSDIVTDNLTAFGLRASDTAHFANVLAAAAANSNTNISIMGETFKNSSAVAGALGYSVEDVAVMVGLMANNAVKGSRAGTALRNIFNGLLGSVTLTADAFGQVEYSAVNADGSMKGLMETVRDLRGYFGQMTESEQVKNAMDIAGMRGYNGLLAILNATDEDFQSLYASINNCAGAAERMAAVKLDNLNGDITIMRSALEGLEITVGDLYNQELRGLARTGTDLLNMLNGFIQQEPELTKGVMAGAGAFALMASAIVGVNAAIRTYQTLKLATLFTGVGPILGGAAAVAGVTAAVVGLTAAYNDGTDSVKELTEAARENRSVMEEAKNAYERTAEETLATAQVAESYIDRLEALGEGTKASNEHSQEYLNILSLLCNAVPELTGYVNLETGAIEGGTEALRENTEEWKKNARERAYQNYLNGLMDQYNAVMEEAAANSIKLTKAQIKLETIEEDREAALARLNELRSKGAVLTEEEEAECYRLQEAIREYNFELLDAASAVDIYTEAVERDKEALAEAEEELSLVDDAWKELMKALGLYKDEQEDVTAGEGTLQGVLDGTTEKLQELAESYQEAYEEATKSFEGQFSLFDEAKKDTDATVKNAQKALNTQLAYWQGYAANIAALKEISAEDLGVTRENYDALMAYVRSGTPEAAGLAADMVKAVNKGNTQALADLANTLGKISESQSQAAQDVADWTAGLTEQMDQFIQSMAEEIGALDLSEEAKEYGRDTVQSWIDAASSDKMLSAVRSAYARLAAAAREELAPLYRESAYWANRTGYNTPGTGYTTGTNSGSPPYSDSAYYANRVSGYASGTDNAPPGYAWVGEKGPELMYMHGGEQIIPAEASRRLAEDYAAYRRYTAENGDTAVTGGVYSGDVRPGRALEVSTAGTTAGAGTKLEMHFHIEAGASPETVDAWQEYARSGALRATVLEVMEDAEADRRRRDMV